MRGGRALRALPPHSCAPRARFAIQEQIDAIRVGARFTQAGVTLELLDVSDDAIVYRCRTGPTATAPRRCPRSIFISMIQRRVLRLEEISGD